MKSEKKVENASSCGCIFPRKSPEIAFQSMTFIPFHLIEKKRVLQCYFDALSIISIIILLKKYFKQIY